MSDIEETKKDTQPKSGASDKSRTQGEVSSGGSADHIEGAEVGQAPRAPEGASGVVLGVDKLERKPFIKSLKREEWWAIVIAATIFAVPLLWFWPQTQVETVPVPAVSLNACGYENNQAAMDAAIDEADVTICDCIERNVNLQTDCERGVSDIALYLEAINQYDPSLCAAIEDDSKRNACSVIAASAVERVGEGDAQVLADHLSFNRNTDAIPLYERILEEERDNIDNLLSLAYAYAHKGLEEEESGGLPEVFAQKAIDTLDRAVALDSENVEVYRAYGYAYEIFPDILKAIEHYDQAIAIDPEHVLAYAGRGHAYQLNGNLDQALADYQKADELDVNNEAYEVYEGLCQLESTNSEYYADAKTHCTIVIDATDASPAVRSNARQVLALVLLAEGDVNGARSELLAAKTLTPNDPNLYVSLGEVALAEEDYYLASSEATQALEHASVKAAAYAIIAYAHFKIGDFENAINAAETGLAQIDEDVSLLSSSKDAYRRDLYYTLANIYHNTGDAEKEAEYKALGDALTS